jgi:hypothetical protein
MPVNKDMHWSLCAVFNAALVNNSVDHTTQEVPYMLFLAPLDYHSRVDVVRNVRNHLNTEWNNTTLTVFNNLTMESFSPQGMFICILPSSLTIMLLLLSFPSTFCLFPIQFQNNLMLLIVGFSFVNMLWGFTNCVT